jgi:hypothetical protein
MGPPELSQARQTESGRAWRKSMNDTMIVRQSSEKRFPNRYYQLSMLLLKASSI